MASLVVLGIGNILLTDDGVGIHLVNRLMQEGLPGTIMLIDGGTCTLDTLGLFLDYDTVLIIDALKGGHPPGTIYKLKPDDIKDYTKENISLHDIQIPEVVSMAKRLGKEPRVIIYGIEPEIISPGLNLSSALEGKLNQMTAYLKGEILTAS